MNYIEELKQKLAEGTNISDLISCLPEDFDIDAFLSKIESENSADNKVVAKLAQAALGCFTTIDIPDSTYTSNTTKLDIEGLTLFQSYSSIGDADLTVNFSTPLIRFDVPYNWRPWAEPPYVESSTPPILFTGYNVSSITFNLSKPVCTFGFELMPNLLTEITVTVEFYSGDELVGTIQKSLNANARLFAAKTCCCTPFDRVVASIDEPYFGFSIAQVRYNTDCSSKCDSCLSDPTPITIKAGNDLTNLPLQITNSSCNGRLLSVDVTVTACQKRSVVVGVLVYDSTGEKILRFKACEACMPESTDPNAICVQNTFNFLFVFEKELCDSLQLNVKTLVEYACFDFSI